MIRMKIILLLLAFTLSATISMAEEKILVTFINGGGQGDGNVNNTTDVLINACLQTFAPDPDLKAKISFTNEPTDKSGYYVLTKYNGRYSKGICGFTVIDATTDEVVFAYNTPMLKRKDLLMSSNHYANEFYKLFKKVVVNPEE